MEKGGGEVVVYEAPDGEVRVDVRLERETIWLTQAQMAEVFSTTTDNIGLHLRNIFADGELDEASTTEESSVVRKEGTRAVRRRVKHFNLDAVISVGYRVSSARATSFRRWATNTLRSYLLHGYALDRKRLARNADELEAALALVRKVARGPELTSDQGRGLVDVIARYTQTFLLLQRFDEGLLSEPKGRPGGRLASASEAREQIARLKAV